MRKHQKQNPKRIKRPLWRKEAIKRRTILRASRLVHLRNHSPSLSEHRKDILVSNRIQAEKIKSFHKVIEYNALIGVTAIKKLVTKQIQKGTWNFRKVAIDQPIEDDKKII